MTSMPPPGYEQRQADGHSWAATGGGPEPPALDPLSLRLLRTAGGLSVLLIALVAFAWLHGGGGNPLDPLNPIAKAAARTQLSPGSRSAIVATYSSPAFAEPMVMTGEGVLNGQTGRSRVTMTAQLPSPAGGAAITATGNIEMEAIGDGGTVYMRSPLFAASLPPGKEWMSIAPHLGQTAETAFAPGGDAEGQLEMLNAASGDVDRIGEEEVRGVATTRHRGTIDLGHYADTLREKGDEVGARQYEQLEQAMPTPTAVEAWIDTEGLLRRMRMVMSPPTGDAPTGSMDMRMEFFDFGITPDVPVPSPDEVFDATPLAMAQLGISTPAPSQHASDQAGDRPLPTTAFHRRASRICTGIFRELDELKRETAPQLKALKGFEPVGNDPEAIREAFLAVARDYAYAFLEPALRLLDDGLRELGRLTPPADLEADFKRFLHFSAQGMELTRAEARAIEVGEFDTADRLSDRTHVLSDHSDRNAEAAGLDACVEADHAGAGA